MLPLFGISTLAKTLTAIRQVLSSPGKCPIAGTDANTHSSAIQANLHTSFATSAATGCNHNTIVWSKAAPPHTRLRGQPRCYLLTPLLHQRQVLAEAWLVNGVA